MVLLRLLSLPYVRKHILRSVLTVTGIMLGVAVFVGMRAANDSVLQGFRDTVDRIAGTAQLQIAAGDAGFDESVLERVQSLPDVRTAVPIIEAVADIPGQGSVLVLAVDMTGDRALRRYEFQAGDEELMDDPLVFLARPDSLIVTRQLAGRAKLRIGSRIPMRTMDGEKQLTVRGIMQPGGLASAYGGNLAVMDVYSAQKFFGRGRRFDRIDLAVTHGASVESVRETLRAMLGPGFQVEPPAARGQHLESMARAFSRTVDFTSWFALLVGVFIIHNAFAIAVVRRRTEIGVLRALGATRAQVLGLFLGESLVAGLLGSSAGVVAGVTIAEAVRWQLGNMLGTLYDVGQQPGGLQVDARLLAAAAGLGVLTSLVSGFLPARSAAAVDPVKALRRGSYEILSAGESRVRRTAASWLGAASLAAVVFGRTSGLLYAAYVGTVLAALLLTPTLCHWLARALRPVLAAVDPVQGALAADSIINAPRRTSAAVSALMLALALGIGLAGIARSTYASVRDWVDTTLNCDLFVTPSDSLTKRDFLFPGEMESELRDVPAIDEVQPARSLRVRYRERPILLIAIDTAALGRRAPLRVVAGDRTEMLREASAGRGVIIAENLAQSERLRPGDRFDLDTPAGRLTLPVCGIVRDYSDQSGVVFLDLPLYRRYWNDDSVSVFRVFLRRGADPDGARRQILERVGRNRRVFVLTNADVRAFIMGLADRWFGLTWIQLLVAVLVAVLAIANTLTVSIADRRQELAVLQAVGALRAQVRGAVWLEAIAIAGIGVLLGLVLGAANLFFTLALTVRDIAGIGLDYMYPWGVSALMWPVILAAAFLAAIAPAESVVRSSLSEALEYE
jgi:putative ABC transport system permease protein